MTDSRERLPGPQPPLIDVPIDSVAQPPPPVPIMPNLGAIPEIPENLTTLHTDATAILTTLAQEVLGPENVELGERLAAEATLAAATGDIARSEEVNAKALLVLEKARIATHDARHKAFMLALGVATRGLAAGVKFGLKSVVGPVGFLLAVFLLVPGCSFFTPPAGGLKASNIKPAVDIVTQRHDDYVRTGWAPNWAEDGSWSGWVQLDPDQTGRATSMLETSALLRATVDRAYATEQAPSVAQPPE